MGFPVDESAIIRAEAALGRRLPDTLRARLMRDNGGEIDADNDVWALIPVFDDSDRRRLTRTANHIVRETDSARRGWRGFPEGAVVVADDGSGDLVVLLPGSDDFHLWRHEDATVGPIGVDL